MVKFLYIKRSISAAILAFSALFLTQPAAAQTPQWVNGLSAHSALDGLAPDKRRDATCVALAIYFEARGESRRGQIAVGNVVMNRVRDRRYPDTACGVLFQKGQFSFIRKGQANIPSKKGQSWNQSMELARAVISGNVADVSQGTRNFRHKRLRTAGLVIGNHIFF